VSTTIIFVRHGETAWNLEQRYQGQEDSPLSEQGRRQAQLVGEFLSKRKITAVYTSDLGRAVLTAKCIADPHNLTPIVDERLREMSFGDWEGMTREEVVEQYPELYRARQRDNSSHPIPGGEQPGEVIQRFLSCLEEIVARHPGETIVVVSHGAALRMTLASLLAIPLGRSQCLSQSNGGISELVYNGPGASCPWRVITLNSTAHLLEHNL
jgi:broad specificity phosphatase PhoE